MCIYSERVPCTHEDLKVKLTFTHKELDMPTCAYHPSTGGVEAGSLAKMVSFCLSDKEIR